MFDFFDTKICLNQKSRVDRWQQFEQEAARVRLKDVQQFYSIEASSAYESFCLSQRVLLESFIASDGKVLLALEDDVIFKDLSYFDEALTELPDNWDILYLGANVTDSRPHRISKHLFKIQSAWTTHAVAYSRKMAEEILRLYINWEQSGMYDDWLSRVILPVNNCYIIAPMVAWQRPVFSDIWGQNVEYGWAEIDKRLV